MTEEFKVLDWRPIQGQLKLLGFYAGPIDGIVGPKTNDAISAFKRSIGFNPRPYYGPLTHEALMGATQPSTIPWMAEASRVRGLHETRDGVKLRAWFEKTLQWVNPKEVPWCGAFVATCIRRWDPDEVLPTNPLGARNWAHYGAPLNVPSFGSVLVFWRGSERGWQGHVGFYWGEDSEAYHVLGGNQSDEVNVTRVSRKRLLAARWPKDFPVSGGPILLSKSGIPLSTNEG